MEFKIYQDGTSTGSGSTLKWTEDYLVAGSTGMPSTGGIAFTSGTFQVNLGSICALSGGTCGAKTNTGIDFNQQTLWLSMQIGNSSSCTVTSATTSFNAACGGDGEMSPYVRLTAVPQALNADKLDGIDSTAFAQLAQAAAFTSSVSIQPSSNVVGLSVKQNSSGSPTADIFDVATQNNTSIITVSGPSLNAAAVTINSVGSQDLSLGSGSGIIKIISPTTTLQKSGSALTLDVSNGNSNSTLTISNSGGSGNITFSLDTGGVFAVGASTGSTISACGTSNYISSFASTGGIITGGSCSTIASSNLSDTANIPLLNAANTFAPTANTSGTTVKQTSGTATSGNVFDIQGSNGTSHFFQIAQTAANAGSITLQSLGSNDLTLDSGSTTLKFGTNTTTLQKSATAFTLDVNNASNSTLTVTNAGTGNITLQLETGGTYAVGASTGSSISTCGAGNYVSGFNSVGGIVVAGSCVQIYGNSSTRKVTLAPEFPGAVMTPVTAGTHVGSMTSDFCSGTAHRSINTGVCTVTTEDHNYYSWTANATNDYDIWARWQVPSDFSTFSAASFYGWRTSTSDAVTVTLYNATGTSCGSASISGTVDTWNNTSLTTSCTPSPGDVFTIDTHLSVGVNNEFARVGEITLTYNRL